MPSSRKSTGSVDPRSRKEPKRGNKAPVSPALPKKAIKANLPPTLFPQLATLVDAPPNDALEWVYEIKLDGYRLLARIEEGEIWLFTRRSHDWSHKLPHIVKPVAEMDLVDGWLDGEIVAPGQTGIPDFQAL